MLPSVTPYNSLDTNKENPVLPEIILIIFIGFGKGIYYAINTKLKLFIYQRLLVFITYYLKVDNYNPTVGKIKII